MSFKFDRLIDDKKYGYIFEEDKNYFDDVLDHSCQWSNIKPDQWSEGIKNCPKCLQLGLKPIQIVGDVNNAKIFLLNLNPSFSDDDMRDERKLEPYISDSLLLNYTDCLSDYPFYFLNPDNIDTAGAKWWRNGYHFKSYLMKYDQQQLAKKFCCIELFPYHARKLPIDAKKLMNFPSVIKVKKFVQAELIKKARGKEIMIISLRSRKLWGIECEDIDNNLFFGSNVRNSYFGFNENTSYYNTVQQFLL